VLYATAGCTNQHNKLAGQAADYQERFIDAEFKIEYDVLDAGGSSRSKSLTLPPEAGGMSESTMCKSSEMLPAAILRSWAFRSPRS
jgi:hypothetical protein